ncbi:MAG: FtsW/RodA/SpoVE family cell cycle protein, partial [Actinomycetota bacterium]
MKLKLHKQKIRKRSRTQTANGAHEYVFLATATMMMLALGTVMVFSAGLASAYFDQEDSYYWLLRQLAFGAIGIICMFLLSRLDFYRLRKAAPFFMTASLALLLLVLIPGIGAENNGARRWLALSVVNPQPSEIAKLAVVLSLAAVMSSRPRLLTSTREMSLRILVFPAAVCFL